jgi:hypothetical protein
VTAFVVFPYGTTRTYIVDLDISKDQLYELLAVVSPAIGAP